MDPAGDKLMEEVRAVLGAAEELLKESGAAGGERLEALHGKVREHPVAAVAIAAAAGLVLGLLLARK